MRCAINQSINSIIIAYIMYANYQLFSKNKTYLKQNIIKVIFRKQNRLLTIYPILFWIPASSVSGVKSEIRVEICTKCVVGGYVDRRTKHRWRNGHCRNGDRKLMAPDCKRKLCRVG